MKVVKRIEVEYVIPSKKKQKELNKAIEDIKAEDKKVNPKSLKVIHPKKEK